VGDIKIDLGEVGRGVMNWYDLVQNREWRRALVNKVMKLRVL
jgi:hypothetical protein